MYFFSKINSSLLVTLNVFTVWQETCPMHTRLLFYFFKILFIFKERRIEGERENCRCVREALISCFLHSPPTRDLGHNPGMYLDGELNLQPFGLQNNTQPTEPHRSGLGNFWEETPYFQHSFGQDVNLVSSANLKNNFLINSRRSCSKPFIPEPSQPCLYFSQWPHVWGHSDQCAESVSSTDHQGLGYTDLDVPPPASQPEPTLAKSGGLSQPLMKCGESRWCVSLLHDVMRGKAAAPTTYRVLAVYPPVLNALYMLFYWNPYLILRYHYPSLWWESKGSKGLNNSPKVTKLVIELRFKLDLTCQVELMNFSQSCSTHTFPHLSGWPLQTENYPWYLSSHTPTYWLTFQVCPKLEQFLSASMAATLISHLHYLSGLFPLLTLLPATICSQPQPEWSFQNITEVLSPETSVAF